MTTAPHIMLATPMYGGLCYGFWHQAVCGLIRACQAHNIGFSQVMIYNESLITRARNNLAHQFLKSNCTHLLFIDADIDFDPMHIIAMIQADVDILCGVYPKKEINWPMVERAVKEGVPAEELKKHTAAFVLNLLNYANEITIPNDKPFEILAGGTGCMLIKRPVFETMKSLVPAYTNDVVDLGGQTGADKISEFFATSIDPQSDRLLSEDYHFCFKWREAGGKVHAAPWVKLKHVGTYVFEGGMLDA